ncbi:MAG: mannose-1-phosphate guanylyltransferase [Pseudomonadota bacterium]|nr:MAG: mannose-1-phosphate guanylyltransferase [Pseudomonadota bacterium]
MSPRLFALVLAGGSGTRFWPLSRKSRPKQFLSLTGRPLVVETVARLEGLCDPADVTVICGEAHAEVLGKLLPEHREGILVEPAARGTAPAIGLAALLAQARDPEGILVVLPSDHAIADVRAFRAAIRHAAGLAAEGALVTLGIRPTRPETGFGYIEVGEAIPGRAPARRARAFVEKPDLPTAERYLAGGAHLWNAGIFVFRADRILEELAAHAPDVHRVLEALRPALGTAEFPEALRAHFPRSPSISIDHAVMEKSRSIAVIPCEFGWSDLGTVAALSELFPADASGNALRGEALAIDSSRNVVWARPGKAVALVGCEDLVVIDTEDALLVCHRDRAQEVRRVVEALERKGREELV